MVGHNLNHVSKGGSSLPIVSQCMFDVTTYEMDNTLYLYAVAMHFSEFDNASGCLMLHSLHILFYSWQGRNRQQMAWVNSLFLYPIDIHK